jgi:hypothetical protein
MFSAIVIAFCFTGCYTRLAIPAAAPVNIAPQPEQSLDIIIVYPPPVHISVLPVRPVYPVHEVEKAEAVQTEPAQRPFIRRGAESKKTDNAINGHSGDENQTRRSVTR